jgi:hypothetical protein
MGIQLLPLIAFSGAACTRALLKTVLRLSKRSYADLLHHPAGAQLVLSPLESGVVRGAIVQILLGRIVVITDLHARDLIAFAEGCG